MTFLFDTFGVILGDIVLKVDLFCVERQLPFSTPNFICNFSRPDSCIVVSPIHFKIEKPF